MSRKWVLFLCAVIMLALALVVARVFREPLPPLDGEEAARVGDSVSGPLQTASTAPLPSPLPSPEAMIMRSGDSAPLPVTTVEPRAAGPTGVAPVVRVAPSGAGTVTEPPAPPSGPEPTPPAPAGETPDAPSPAPLSPAPDRTEPAPSPPAVSPSAPVAEAPSPSESSAPPASPARDAKPDNPLKPGTLITRSTLPAKAGSRTVTSATLTMDGDVVTLNLRGDGAMRGKTFILADPDRVVLDIEGDWKVEAPRVPSNRMVRSLRVGARNAATRLVFDMRVKPGQVRVTNPDADSLKLTIR